MASSSSSSSSATTTTYPAPAPSHLSSAAASAAAGHEQLFSLLDIVNHLGLSLDGECISSTRCISGPVDDERGISFLCNPITLLAAASSSAATQAGPKDLELEDGKVGASWNSFTAADIWRDIVMMEPSTCSSSSSTGGSGSTSMRAALLHSEHGCGIKPDSACTHADSPAAAAATVLLLQETRRPANLNPYAMQRTDCLSCDSNNTSCNNNSGMPPIFLPSTATSHTNNNNINNCTTRDLEHYSQYHGTAAAFNNIHQLHYSTTHSCASPSSTNSCSFTSYDSSLNYGMPAMPLLPLFLDDYAEQVPAEFPCLVPATSSHEYGAPEVGTCCANELDNQMTAAAPAPGGQLKQLQGYWHGGQPHSAAAAGAAVGGPFISFKDGRPHLPAAVLVPCKVMNHRHPHNLAAATRPIDRHHETYTTSASSSPGSQDPHSGLCMAQSPALWPMQLQHIANHAPLERAPLLQRPLISAPVPSKDSGLFYHGSEAEAADCMMKLPSEHRGQLQLLTSSTSTTTKAISAKSGKASASSKLAGTRMRRNVRISKDPQSVAARQRRERISERFRTLQRLVPGAKKLDTASMLEKAIQYLKLLKSQTQAFSHFSTEEYMTWVSFAARSHDLCNYM